MTPRKPFGWDYQIAGINCLPGLWRLYRSKSILPYSDFTKGALDTQEEILFVHDQIDPTTINLGGYHRILRSFVSTEKLMIVDPSGAKYQKYDSCFIIKKPGHYSDIIHLPYGYWCLRGNFGNNGRIHTNDYKNTFLILSGKRTPVIYLESSNPKKSL